MLCVVNQKGGVGKTTTAVNLAASVGAAEKRTLLLDMDPQGNASSGVGVRPGTTERSVYDVLIGRSRLDEVIVATEIKHLFVAPATQDLVAAELELVDDPQRATRLLDAIKALTTRSSTTSSSTARRRSACSRSTRSPRASGCSSRCSASTTRSRG